MTTLTLVAGAPPRDRLEWAAVAGLLGFVVFFLCAKAIFAIVTVAFGTLPAPDLSRLSAYLTPANIVIECLTGGLIAPLLAAIVYGAPAAAYRALKSSGTT